jgi:hypothetical protein
MIRLLRTALVSITLSLTSAATSNAQSVEPPKAGCEFTDTGMACSRYVFLDDYKQNHCTQQGSNVYRCGYPWPREQICVDPPDSVNSMECKPAE